MKSVCTTDFDSDDTVTLLNLLKHLSTSPQIVGSLRYRRFRGEGDVETD